MAISWWPAIAASLHMVEEFVFPGGFPDWDRAYRPAIAASITPRFHFWINALLLGACLSVATAGPTSLGIAGWLALAALLASNAIFHIVGSIRTRSYSPGLVTGVVLYLPMAVFGFAHFVHTGQASAGTAFANMLLGGSYHLWAAMAHRRRAAAAR